MERAGTISEAMADDQRGEGIGGRFVRGAHEGGEEGGVDLLPLSPL